MSRNSYSSNFVFIILFIALALPTAANFFGPWQGWITRLLREQKKGNNVAIQTDEKPAEHPLPVIETPTKALEKVKEQTTPADTESDLVEKSGTESLFDELLAKYRAKFPDPEIGKTYTVYLKDGKSDEGQLVEASDGRIVMKLEYGQMSLPIQSVSKRSYPDLFPKQAAKLLAMRELQERLQPKEVKIASTARNLESGNDGTISAKASACEYDPSPAETPEKVRDTVADYGFWLKAQQRRMGGQVAEKIYAKRHGHHLVLYLKTSRNFQRQPYDFRFTVTEALWNIWAFKCLDFGHVPNLNHAHVVLLGNGGKIIGGSTEEDGAGIWVKR